MIFTKGIRDALINKMLDEVKTQSEVARDSRKPGFLPIFGASWPGIQTPKRTAATITT